MYIADVLMYNALTSQEDGVIGQAAVRVLALQHVEARPPGAGRQLLCREGLWLRGFACGPDPQMVSATTSHPCALAMNIQLIYLELRVDVGRGLALVLRDVVLEPTTRKEGKESSG